MLLEALTTTFEDVKEEQEEEEEDGNEEDDGKKSWFCFWRREGPIETTFHEEMELAFFSVDEPRGMRLVVVANTRWWCETADANADILRVFYLDRAN